MLLSWSTRSGPRRHWRAERASNSGCLGSFGALATVLATRCHAEFCAGDWATAPSSRNEVLDIASVTGQQRQAAFVNAYLAYIATAQGRTDDAQQRRQQIGAWATASRHRLIAALASWSQVVAALGAGETDLAAQAVATMRPVGAAAADRGALLVASACPDVVEAFVRAGQAGQASAVLAWARARVARWPSPTLAAHAAHARAVLTEFSDATPSDIDSAYEEAIGASADRAGFRAGPHRAALRRVATAQPSTQPGAGRT